MKILIVDFYLSVIYATLMYVNYRQVKARSVDVVESSRWCNRPLLRPGAREDRHPRARPSASMRERAAAMRPPCKRDPDIFLDNEPIGQQPRVHTYTAQT